MLSRIVEVAEEAGNAILKIYAREFSVEQKADRSPLTEADIASHQTIIRGLTSMGSDLPVLSEESAAAPYVERRLWDDFWMVDPLDGTKEFIGRNGEFTVNIALIRSGKPVMGVVHAPVLGTTYWANEHDAWRKSSSGKESIRCAHYSGGTLKVVASRSHAGPETEAALDTLRREVPALELVSKGSSLKLCMVADGQAHLYPRLGSTMEWDIAAAAAVVQGAGGILTDVHGVALGYNKENLLNPWFVVRSSDSVPFPGINR